MRIHQLPSQQWVLSAVFCILSCRLRHLQHINVTDSPVNLHSHDAYQPLSHYHSHK